MYSILADILSDVTKRFSTNMCLGGEEAKHSSAKMLKIVI